MKSIKTLFRIAIVLVFSCALGGIVNAMIPSIPLVPACGLYAGARALQAFAFPTIYLPGVKAMGIDVEVWENVIIKNIFKDNSFLNLAFNADEFVLNGKVVHIPQAGAKPVVVKNRSSFPGTAVRRTDTDVTYPLDDYTTDPSHITKREQETISYDKITDILQDHQDTLNDVIGDAIIYKWSTTVAGNMVRTTGGDVVSHVTGGTGNRKKLLKEDIKKLQTKMNVANVPKKDRYLMLDAEMLSQLLEDADLMKRDTARELNLEDGVIMKLYGFNILERSQAGRYTNATPPVPLDYDAAGAATHNAAGIAWQKNAVERAIGTTTLFQDLNNPLYYGDIYSILCSFGGRIRKSDQFGVYAIVQDAGS